MTSAYTPRPGSVAERAFLELQARGPRAGAALADAIDCETPNLAPCLLAAVKHGYIERTRRDGLYWYACGDGTPPHDLDDDEPVVQRIVRAPPPPRAAVAPATAPKSKRRAGAVTVRSPNDPPPRAARTRTSDAVTIDAAAVAELSCAVFNTGDLLIEAPGQSCLRLNARQCADLVAYLQRFHTAASAA